MTRLWLTYSVVGFLETLKHKTFLLTTITQFFFLVVGNYLMYLALLLVIFLELNNNCGICSIIIGLNITHACLAWLPLKILSVCWFVKIRCCCLQCLLSPPKMMLHTWRKYAVLLLHFETNCLFCHPLLSPGIPSSLTYKGFIIYLSDIIVKVFIICIPMISTSKYIAGSRKLLG